MRLGRCTISLVMSLVSMGCSSSRAQVPPSHEGKPAPDTTAATSRDEDWTIPRHGRRPFQPVPPASRAAYSVEIAAGDGNLLRTYSYGGHTYVLGTLRQRYQIRVVNPTASRVEAVVSVDGLDAVDGRAASYDKRGYVVPAYGEVTIEGFRTSMDNVAAFRFSAVRDSYAARKGEDRNVGVIGVAIFPERVSTPAPLRTWESGGRRRGSLGDIGGSAARTQAPPAAAAPAAGEAPTSNRAEQSARSNSSPHDRDRPGLGTEFGEQRRSSVHNTEFTRAAPYVPAYVGEVRYDDREGLLALGIPVDGSAPDWTEVERRQSADPFPNARFALPPP